MSKLYSLVSHSLSSRNNNSFYDNFYDNFLHNLSECSLLQPSGSTIIILFILNIIILNP